MHHSEYHESLTCSRLFTLKCDILGNTCYMSGLLSAGRCELNLSRHTDMKQDKSNVSFQKHMCLLCIGALLHKIL